MNFKSFGKNPAGERLQKIREVSNYRDGSFQNVEPTLVSPDVSIFSVLKKMLTRPSSVSPGSEIPYVQTNLKDLNSNEPVVVWFGHSSYMIHLDGFNILVDPVFSGTASPFRFFGKAFPGSDTFNAEDFPKIDLLILTHDHYDHLDWESIRELNSKVKTIITSLGVGSHLEYWGVTDHKFSELNWWESKELSEEIKITATPARHFSGRGFKRSQTLWSSFVLEIKGYRFFIGSDSGYDGSFRKIGDSFGSFDLAFLECGQYNKFWPQIHMFPEETVQAAQDLNAGLVQPVHWGKFTLSTHPWNEPVKRFIQAAKKENVNFVVPKIGEAYSLNNYTPRDPWWEFENIK